MNRRAVVAAVLACTALTGWACGLIVDHDVHQCTSNEECDMKGGAFKRAVCVDTTCRGALACADGKPVPRETNIAVNQRVKFTAIDGTTPMVGAKVLVCPQLENRCPDASLRNYTTDEAGFINAEVPSGFRGTFEVHETPPMLAGQDFIKTILYTRRFLTESEAEDSGLEPTQATRLVARGVVDLLLAKANKPAADPAKGLVFGAVFDCNAQPLPGARVEMVGASEGLEPGVTRFYGDAVGFPTPTEEETSSSGIFGLANVDLPDAGARSLALRIVVHDASGAEIQWSKFEVTVARERLTSVGVRYSP